MLGFAGELCWHLLPDRKLSQLRGRAAPAYYVVFDPPANQHWVRDLWSLKLIPRRDIVMGDDPAMKSILLLREGISHPFGAGGAAPAQAASTFADSTFTQWSELDPLVFKAFMVDPVYG